MSFRDQWILSKAAPTIRELHTGQGCHLDEAITLCNYLNKIIGADSAARAITAASSASTCFRLWTLLADTLMHFEEDCEMILKLLVCIQKLTTNTMSWWGLPGFVDEWQRYYESHREDYQGNWCLQKATPYRRQYCRKAGLIEAKMYLEGIPGIDELDAYRTINLVCSREQDLQVVIYEIHAWLQVAGSRLAETLDPNANKSFARAVRGRSGRTYAIKVTMFEHWQHWKKTFLEISYDDELLSTEARELARQCYETMKAQHVKLPFFVDDFGDSREQQQSHDVFFVM
ncbi:hypothetical protein FSARC_1975 [Fusarium sarcochroum]|uniref:Uncharacterized protein n=1 Tax=Fusarium sarcochroum TaxID=1208366 RepID=A0A8H4U7P5_9HYPO|nr:hypothetical protein FSARC_1975 [Fusarium sarcochroum]